MVQFYITSLFKDFGLSQETEFPPDEFFKLYNKFNKLQELSAANDSILILNQQLSYQVNREGQIVSDIESKKILQESSLLDGEPTESSIAIGVQISILESEMIGVTNQKTSISNQIISLQGNIDILKNEMELI